MTNEDAQQVLDRLVGTIFGYQNPFTLEQFRQKYAFDLRLPLQVTDYQGQTSWSQNANPSKYMKVSEAHSKEELEWIKPTRPLNSVEEILAAWGEVNFIVTERELDSLNVLESDNIYSSENVYRSQDISDSKHILFCDGIFKSEFVAASQRSNSNTFCARLSDSKECANSFEVPWSKKVVNSMFIHDSNDMYECLFCSHITSRQFCIANMQFEEADYYRLKELVVNWILTS